MPRAATQALRSSGNAGRTPCGSRSAQREPRGRAQAGRDARRNPEARRCAAQERGSTSPASRPGEPLLCKSLEVLFAVVRGRRLGLYTATKKAANESAQQPSFPALSKLKKAITTLGGPSICAAPGNATRHLCVHGCRCGSCGAGLEARPHGRIEHVGRRPCRHGRGRRRGRRSLGRSCQRSCASSRQRRRRVKARGRRRMRHRLRREARSSHAVGRARRSRLLLRLLWRRRGRARAELRRRRWRGSGHGHRVQAGDCRISFQTRSASLPKPLPLAPRCLKSAGAFFGIAAAAAAAAAACAAAAGHRRSANHDPSSLGLGNRAPCGVRSRSGSIFLRVIIVVAAHAKVGCQIRERVGD